MKIQKNWTKVALCTLSFTHTYSITSNSISIIKQSCIFIIKIDQELSKFFSTDNDVTYNNYIISLGHILSEFENKIERITRSPNDILGNKAYDIAQEAKKHFNAAYKVIAQYQGRSSKDAGSFVSDLSSVFSIEIAFKNISTKLHALLKDAIAENETELVTIIKHAITTLEKKNNDWLKKSKTSLLTGLARRMGK